MPVSVTGPSQEGTDVGIQASGLWAVSISKAMAADIISNQSTIWPRPGAGGHPRLNISLKQLSSDRNSHRSADIDTACFGFHLQKEQR